MSWELIWEIFSALVLGFLVFLMLKNGKSEPSKSDSPEPRLLTDEDIKAQRAKND